MFRFFFLPVLLLTFNSNCFSSWRPGEWLIYPNLRYIASLACDTRYLYIGTKESILRYDRLLKVWDSPQTHVPADLLAIDRYSGDLFVSTTNRLYKYNFTFRNPYFIQSFDAPISSIGIDLSYIWILTSSSLYRGSRFGTGFESVSQESLNKKAIEWFGSCSPDSLRDPKYTFLSPGYIIGPGLKKLSITSLVREPIGSTVWVGTWGGGVYEYNMFSLTGKPMTLGPGIEEIRAIANDGDLIWFGGNTSSTERVPVISNYDKREQIWNHFEPWINIGLKNATVHSIAADSNYVWFATSDNLTRYDKRRKDWKTYSIFEGLRGKVTSLCYAEGKLYIGTESGTNSILRGSSRTEKIEELGNMPIYDIKIKGKEILIGASNGVFLKSHPDSSWKNLRSSDGSLDFNVLSIYPSLYDETIWFATDRTIMEYDENTKNFKRHFEAPFFPNVRVYSISGDSENIWVGTDKGMLRYERKNKFWRTYTTFDGLPDNNIYSLLLDGNFIWIGTNKGLVKYLWK